jgi:hypothetical protein
MWTEWMTVTLKNGTELIHGAVFAADGMIKKIYKHLAA